MKQDNNKLGHRVLFTPSCLQNLEIFSNVSSVRAQPTPVFILGFQMLLI